MGPVGPCAVLNALGVFGCFEPNYVSLNGRNPTPTPKCLGTAEAYLVCHIGPKFKVSLIFAFIGCP